MDLAKIMAEYFRTPKGAVITLVYWTMMPDGNKYLHIFCDRWNIATDKMIGIEGFRSSEHWQLIGLTAAGKVLAIIPGCQVKSFIRCSTSPESNDCAHLK